MKRFISVILVFVFLLSFAACSGENAPAATAEPTLAPTEEPADVSVTETAPVATETPAPTEIVTEAPTEAAPTEPAQGTPMPERHDENEVGLPRVIAGADVFFIVNSDASLCSWGNNAYGQLGTGDTEDRYAPVYVADGLTPVIVGDTVFALSSDNILWGWGRNDLGQLGTGDTKNRTKPVELMHFVKEVYKVGNSTYYALTESGDLYTWGLYNADGTNGSFSPTLYSENVDGFYRCCIIKNGELWSLLGNGPKMADGIKRVFDIYGYFAEGTDGKLYNVSMSGNKTLICDSFRDVQISGFDSDTAYILMEDGALYKYCIDPYVDGNPDPELNRLIYIMNGVVEIRADFMMDEDWGYSYAFALKANGELWGWSEHSCSALVGRPEDDDSPEPACVATDVKSFVTNNTATYIIKNDGSVWATGEGIEEDFIHCALGDGTAETRFGFVRLALDNIRAVTSLLNEVIVDYDDGTDGVLLYARTFAFDNDGRLFAWGWNGDGYLVKDGPADVLAPVEIVVK